MRPNKVLIVPFSAIDDVAQVMDVPRGELFNVAMNPYNGNVVFNFQDNPNARMFIRLIVNQFACSDDMFSASAPTYPDPYESDGLGWELAEVCA